MSVRGQAPKGAKAYGKGPRNWENITLIASLSAEDIGAAVSVEGATDGGAFEAHMEHSLLPTLKKGQIIAMDNLQVCKGLKVRELIEGARTSVLPTLLFSGLLAHGKSVLQAQEPLA